MARPPVSHGRTSTAGRGHRAGGPRGPRRYALLLAGAVLPLALVGACHNPGDIRSDNPYQVSVEKKTFRTEVPMPRVVHQDGRRRVALPRGFLADYQRRGRSPMRIMPPPSRTAEDIEAVRALERWLGDQGIPTEVLDPATAYDYVPPMAGHVGLAFRAYAAVVPVCGDWSGEAGFNPTGLPHTNFGCAVNRNIGLMLSDPGDLERARTAAGYDAGRITVILDKYRQGEVTGTKQPELEEGTASEVAE